MQRGNVYRVKTALATFNAAINALTAVAVDLDKTNCDDFPQALAAGKHMRSRILEVRIVSSDALPWGVQFYGKTAQMGTASLATESYLGEWSFGNTAAPGDGSKITADTFRYYYINGWDLAYQDLDNTGKIHMRLVNWHAANNKAIGNTVYVELALELLQGI